MAQMAPNGSICGGMCLYHWCIAALECGRDTGSTGLFWQPACADRITLGFNPLGVQFTGEDFADVCAHVWVAECFEFFVFKHYIPDNCAAGNWSSLYLVVAMEGTYRFGDGLSTDRAHRDGHGKSI